MYTLSKLPLFLPPAYAKQGAGLVMRGFLQAEHTELDTLNHILAGTDLHHDKQEGVQQSTGPDIACTLMCSAQ